MNDDIILAGILAAFRLSAYPRPEDANAVAKAAITYLKAIKEAYNA